MYKFEDLINKANKIHGNKYQYDKDTYTKMTDKMKIICPIHGEFYQSLHAHINKKQGCPICGKIHENINRNLKNIEKISKNIFFNKCREKYNNFFEYDTSTYQNLASKIKIICPIHGEFYQSAYTHLHSECGCPKCSYENVSKKQTYTTEEFIQKAKKIHGDKYDYSKTEYKNTNVKVCIICPKHGEFWQNPHNHLYGNGCPKCSIEKNGDNNRLSLKDFIERANKIHDFKYDYSKVEYVDYKNRVKIICPIHGDFFQSPDKHLMGHGCQKCGNVLSNNENYLYKYCCNLLGEENVIQSCHKIISPYELDIYIPSLKIAIEYNGLRWHSEEFGKDKNYHLNKLNLCQKKGIKLIQIFEDEYINHKEIVFSKIKHLLGKDNDLPKIYGRKCIVKNISFKESEGFLNKNHIQGSAAATIYLGCYYNEQLIGVMTFKKEKENKWELNRFASDINYHCIGIGGKLFSYFIKNYDPQEIKSFADRRWTINEENNLYTQLGFMFEDYLKPDYKYYNQKINRYQRFHKFGFRKQILHKKYNLPLTMTETEMVKELGYTKIWDCGLLKYIWKNKERSN